MDGDLIPTRSGTGSSRRPYRQRRSNRTRHRLDPVSSLQSSIAQLELRLRQAAHDLSTSAVSDAASTRATPSADTRNLRSEVQSLRENLTALRETLAFLGHESRPEQLRRTPQQASAETQQGHDNPAFHRPISLPSGLPAFQRTSSSTQTVDEFSRPLKIASGLITIPSLAT